MALFDTVHIIGATVYFIFAVLLAWLSRIPRTNPGAAFWAAAMLFGLCGRLTLLFLAPLTQSLFTETLYSFCVIAEKCFLLLGAFQFFNQPKLARPYLLFISVGLAWIALYWLALISQLTFACGLSAFNACVLLLLGILVYREDDAKQTHLNLFISSICVLLALHWLTYPLLKHYPSWIAPGFIIGTICMLLLYLSLISAVLLQFQKRLIDAEHHALDLAYHDPLTGLNNKRYMNTLFDQALILATRPHQMLALIYIDLDNFKPINDNAGHLVGDEVLKIIAKRLLEHTRSTDICARVGGDEFVVIATQLENTQQAQQIAEKILQQCCIPITIDQHHYHLGASIGVSIYPSHGYDLSQLLKNADDAMYKVKKNGKSGLHVFTEPPTEIGTEN